MSTNVFASGFCVGGFYLGYLVGAVIKEVPRNGFILICLLCLMSMSKEVLLSFFFLNDFVFFALYIFFIFDADKFYCIKRQS